MQLFIEGMGRLIRGAISPRALSYEFTKYSPMYKSDELTSAYPAYELHPGALYLSALI